MKILFIHNAYGKYSGEESVVDAQIALLKAHGHEVHFYGRSSGDLGIHFYGKYLAFFTGLYNPGSVVRTKRLLRTFKPDVVHVHNLYPSVSPSVLPVIVKKGVPVVMTVHNYRLVCPNGLFFNNDNICEKCTGKGNEFNCLFHNCEDSIFKTLGYALRNFWARKKKYYLKNVDQFMCLSHFQRDKLIINKFPEEKISVLPNFYSKEISSGYSPKTTTASTYVAWAGRISPEKGIIKLFEAAKLLPWIEFRVAGTLLAGYEPGPTPANVIFLGMLTQEKLNEFYQQAAMLVITSIWYEGFPMILPEAMRFRLPVIVPKLGGLPEIVEEHVTGLHYQPGDANDLAIKIRQLWEDKELCTRLGENGYRKLHEKYSAEVFYKGLMEVYNKVIRKK